MENTEKDYIVRAVAANDMVRGFAVTSRNICETARQKHNTSPVVTAALGRLLTAGTLMGSMMKNDSDLLTLQVKGDGPIGGMTVTADANGNVKGYPNQPMVIIPARADGHLDVGRAVGKGTLYVIKDLGLKEPYSGQTDLQTGEIAEDIAYYYMASEQVPSVVALGVLMEANNTVAKAGGVIIQLMPDAPEQVIDILEGQACLLRSVTELLDEGLTPENILELIMGPLGNFEILEKTDTQFKCNCSKDRVTRAIASISNDDIQEMIDEEKNAEIVCHFCNTAYNFSPDELREILKKKLQGTKARNNVKK